jgi:hypothetical protein
MDALAIHAVFAFEYLFCILLNASPDVSTSIHFIFIRNGLDFTSTFFIRNGLDFTSTFFLVYRGQFFMVYHGRFLFAMGVMFHGHFSFRNGRDVPLFAICVVIGRISFCAIIWVNFSS